MPFKVLTYNMHKGKSFWLRGNRLEQMRHEIDELKPDIVFLQEVPGVHFISSKAWPFYTYGQNAVYQNGHHGNAILSRYEILTSLNTNISQTRLAKRGLLHAKIENSTDNKVIHLLNVHLDLFNRARQKQALYINNYVKQKIPEDESIILAGDFNDWRGLLNRRFTEHFHKAGEYTTKLNTFPSIYPNYDLDRIYFRNLECIRAEVAKGRRWKLLSDHLPLLAEFN